MKYQNIFVLCTGRCGSMSLHKACTHIENYTSGHETRCQFLGEERLDYPSGHIEIDNRLAWFLGKLDRKYGTEAFYVHLVRDVDKVAASYAKRWHHRYSLMRAYGMNILKRHDCSDQVSLDMIDTINANIQHFLRDKPNKLTISVENIERDFKDFILQIGAKVDLTKAQLEFKKTHNSAKSKEDAEFEGLSPTESVILRNRKLLSEINELTHLNKQLKASYDKEKLLAKSLKQNNHKLEETKIRLIKRSNLLLIPYLILLFPVAMPAWLFWKNKKHKQSNAAKNSRWKIFSFLKKEGDAQLKPSTVNDAYKHYISGDKKQAFVLLGKYRDLIPKGTIEIFKAMDATTDDAWTVSMNEWLKYKNLPALQLNGSEGCRFSRIEFMRNNSTNYKHQHKVSVIMPVFNSEKTVEKAIKSILDQTWRNLEVIIVDDASTDETNNIIQKIASTDSRIKVMRNELNVGPYVSKNRALNVATGDYVTGHDGDDIAFPTRIYEQMLPILQNPNKNLATVAYMLRLTEQGLLSRVTRIGKTSFDGVSRFAFISLLIRRDCLIRDIGYWDSVRFAADSEMLARVEAHLGDRLVYLKQVVMLCLSAETSLTNHPEHGIDPTAGISNSRREYSDAWKKWHARNTNKTLKLPLLHTDRYFPAPLEMLVSREKLLRVHSGK